MPFPLEPFTTCIHDTLILSVLQLDDPVGELGSPRLVPALQDEGLRGLDSVLVQVVLIPGGTAGPTPSGFARVAVKHDLGNAECQLDLRGRMKQDK